MGVIILNVTNGANADLAEALILCILLAAFIGFFIGFFIAVFDLNPIVVTLATASIVTGALIWWRSRTSSNDTVPTALADFGALTPLGINIAIFVALGLMILTTLALHYTPIGRRFTSVGANPEAAYIVGIPVTRYVIGGYTMGAIFFGFTGIMVSAFLKTPTTDAGGPVPAGADRGGGAGRDVDLRGRGKHGGLVRGLGVLHPAGADVTGAGAANVRAVDLAGRCHRAGDDGGVDQCPPDRGECAGSAEAAASGDAQRGGGGGLVTRRAGGRKRSVRVRGRRMAGRRRGAEGRPQRDGQHG